MNIVRSPRPREAYNKKQNLTLVIISKELLQRVRSWWHTLYSVVAVAYFTAVVVSRGRPAPPLNYSYKIYNTYNMHIRKLVQRTLCAVNVRVRRNFFFFFFLRRSRVGKKSRVVATISQPPPVCVYVSDGSRERFFSAEEVVFGVNRFEKHVHRSYEQPILYDESGSIYDFENDPNQQVFF